MCVSYVYHMSRYRKFIKRAEEKLLDDEPTDDESYSYSTPAKRAKTKAKTKKKSPQVIDLMSLSDTEKISSDSASDGEDDSDLTPTPEKSGRWKDRTRLSPAAKKAVQAAKRVGAAKNAKHDEDDDDDDDDDEDDDNDDEDDEDDNDGDGGEEEEEEGEDEEEDEDEYEESSGV